MKDIWDACHAGKVEPPKDVRDFFDGEPPGDKPGLEIPLGAAVYRWSDDYRRGFEVNLANLPLDVKILRFYNSH